MPVAARALIRDKSFFFFFFFKLGNLQGRSLAGRGGAPTVGGPHLLVNGRWLVVVGIEMKKVCERTEFGVLSVQSS